MYFTHERLRLEALVIQVGRAEPVVSIQLF